MQCPEGSYLFDELTQAAVAWMEHVKVCQLCYEDFLKNKDEVALSMLLNDKIWENDE